MCRAVQRIFSFMLVAIVLISASSCKKDVTTGKDFTYSIQSDPVCLDPQIVGDESSLIVIKNCMEGLVKKDRSGVIVSGVAQNWDLSDDGLTYTFYLRQNANWHVTDSQKKDLPEDFDSKVTAHDFVFALQRAVSPETGASNAYKLFAIQNAHEINSGALLPEDLGVTAIDDYTLEIKLSKQDDELLETLASSIAMPCNRAFFEYTGGRYGLDDDMYISNGCFYLSNWSRERSLNLRKNPDYAGSLIVHPANVKIYIYSDRSEALNQLKSKELDAMFMSGKEYDTINDRDKYKVSSVPNVVYSLIFNLSSSAVSAYDSRAALCHSIHDSSMAEYSYMDRADGLIMDGISISGRRYSNEYDHRCFDETKARDYLHNLTQDQIDSLDQMTVICIDDKDISDTAAKIIQNWQKYLGVYVKLEILPYDDLCERVADGNYTAAFLPIIYNCEPQEYLRNFTSDSNNNTIRLHSSEYDNLMSQIYSEYATPSVEKIAQAENFLLSNYCVYPIYFSSEYFVTQSNIEDMIFDHFSHMVDFSRALKHN